MRWLRHLHRQPGRQMSAAPERARHPLDRHGQGTAAGERAAQAALRLVGARRRRSLPHLLHHSTRRRPAEAGLQPARSDPLRPPRAMRGLTARLAPGRHDELPAATRRIPTLEPGGASMDTEQAALELHHPDALALLRSAALARLAYTGRDAPPRPIPIGFYCNGPPVL